MHLTLENCWHGTTTSSTLSPLYIICIQKWLFRTQTIFHLYPNFHLPIYFGVSCWNYVVAGIVLIWTAPPAWLVRLQQPSSSSSSSLVEEPSKHRRKPFPYYTFIFFLIFIQCKCGRCVYACVVDFVLCFTHSNAEICVYVSQLRYHF